MNGVRRHPPIVPLNSGAVPARERSSALRPCSPAPRSLHERSLWCLMAPRRQPCESSKQRDLPERSVLRRIHIAQRSRGADVRVVRQPLRKVAKQPIRLRVVLFREQAEIGRQPFGALEHVERFGAVPDGPGIRSARASTRGPRRSPPRTRRFVQVMGGGRDDERGRGDGRHGGNVTGKAVNVSGLPPVAVVLPRVMRRCGLATREAGDRGRTGYFPEPEGARHDTSSFFSVRAAISTASSMSSFTQW
jgi:hypothetical protein